MAARSQQNAAEQIAGALRARISIGGLLPGDKLPTERELALTLGASRTTVREAIRILASEGIVSTTKGRAGGTRVRDHGPLAERPEREALASDFARSISRFIEFRQALEPRAAAMAARRATAEEKADLSSVFTEEIADVAAYHRLDNRFHNSIAKLSGNEIFHEAITSARASMFLGSNVLWLHSDLSSVYQGDGEADDLKAAFHREHFPILAAINSADPELAERHMAQHLAYAGEQFDTLIAGLLRHEH